MPVPAARGARVHTKGSDIVNDQNRMQSRIRTPHQRTHGETTKIPQKTGSQKVNPGLLYDVEITK